MYNNYLFVFTGYTISLENSNDMLDEHYNYTFFNFNYSTKIHGNHDISINDISIYCINLTFNATPPGQN